MSIWIREMDFLANLVKQRIYSSETIAEALDKAEHLKIVRCEDCEYWNEETHGCNRNPSVGAWWESDFCSYGEPRGAEQSQINTIENTNEKNDMGKYNTKRIHHNKCDGGKAYEEVYPNGEHKWFCLGQVDAQYELPVPYDLYDEKCRECPRLFREEGE